MNNDDLNIFQNQKKVADNLKGSAENIGLDVNKEAIERLGKGVPQEVHVVNKNCKLCWGRGTLDYVPNTSNRNYSKPEPIDLKNNSVTKFYCKCVKVRLV